MNANANQASTLRIGYGYAPDRVTPLYGTADRISAAVWRGADGQWRWSVAILIRAECADACTAWKSRFGANDGNTIVWLRQGDVAASRKPAIGAARVELWCHFNQIPVETRYRLERGEERDFPAPGRW
jgi:hypothetical protein